MQILDDSQTTAYEIDHEWITPTKLRPLYLEDPAVVWLELHGASHGFYPQKLPYTLSGLLERKGAEFEQVWVTRMAPDAQRVCTHGSQARQTEYYQQTLKLIEQQVPVISQAVLHCASEKLYGIPDLLVHSEWLHANFPQVCDKLGEYQGYIVLDLKNTGEFGKKSTDTRYYQAQVRLYSYMLGQIQQAMPPIALLVARNQVFQPIKVPISSGYGQPLDADLAAQCERYRRILRHGHEWRPWQHAEVLPNYSTSDDQWADAKKRIQALVPGGAVEQMWSIGPTARKKLHDLGIRSLQALLASDPDSWPTGIIKQREAMLAIMEANRSQRCIHHPAAAPAPHTHEFFVDCEFFNSINIDYEREWPDLKGTPMIFMFGVGWLEQGEWRYRDFIAREETHAAELAMLEEFKDFLLEQTQGNLSKCALYHWSHAERSQVYKAIERHKLPKTHILWSLPWLDLEHACRTNACAIPGAWSYSLKDMARALRDLDASYDPHWPKELSDGGMAQVVGWAAYALPEPLLSQEMLQLRAYLEADCRATYQILRWLREYREA
jgi:hypothetical protein